MKKINWRYPFFFIYACLSLCLVSGIDLSYAAGNPYQSNIKTDPSAIVLGDVVSNDGLSVKVVSGTTPLNTNATFNSGSTLSVVPEQEDGTHGIEISSINYIAGKSGIDAATESIQIIDYDHHEIHSGSHFFYENFTTLGSGATIDLCFQTPNTTKWSHLVFVLSSTLGSQVQIYEDSTITWDGTDLTAANNNRNSGTTSSWVNFQSNPTVTSIGTLLPASAQLGSATNPNNGLPGAGGRDRELILKQNSSYTIRLTSLNNSNVLTYLFEWYEHINKN